MKSKDDLNHTNEFGELEVHKHTKYWFKRDLITIKSSFLFTLKWLPVVFIVSVVVSWLFNMLYKIATTLNDLLTYSFILFPIFSLGLFIFRVLLIKGYEIDPYAGTHVKNPQHRNRFSFSYIFSSDMSLSRKTLFVIRLIFYMTCVFGLLLTVFSSLK